jgi:hypothetical protein
MRAPLLFVSLGVSLGLGLVGCKWTDFDDLEDETWVRSSDDPDLGATEYAIAIAGVSTSSSGGVLAVISDDTPNYSTITYNSAGSSDVGANAIKLGTQNIGALGDSPVFASDPSGRIGLAEKSITGGNFAVLFGSPTAPAAIEFMAAAIPTPAPDAGIFVGTDFVFAAGNAIYTVPSGGMPKTCLIVDDMAMPVQSAGIGADATDLWVWSKTGVLLRYTLASLASCSGDLPPAAGSTPFTTPSFMPASNARVHIQGTFAILAGHATTSRTGEVVVVDLTTMTQVGTTLTVEGLKSTVLADLDSGTYLAIGVPDRSLGGVVAGEVELHEFTPATGALDEAVALKLHDADPESGQLFGRTLTTMQFNGNTILVVGGNAEVFAYYRTALYDHLP